MALIPENKTPNEEELLNEDRRLFLKGAAAATAMGMGAVAIAPTQADAVTPTVAQAAAAEPQGPYQLPKRNYGISNSLTGISPEEKAALAYHSKLPEELPKPAGLRPNGQLDGRFAVSFETSVAEGMRLLTQYFAALTRRDVEGIASTLHFPYATYEGIEPLVYKTAEEFIKDPPPSVNVSSKADSYLRPGAYDMLDNLQLHTYNPVNAGLELCYIRYNEYGEEIGLNQGIYAVTNNDGKWGVQLSSIIFTPTKYLGIRYNDVVEAFLREGRTSMSAYGDHDYGYLVPQAASGQSPTRRTASISGPPEAPAFLLSAWAGTPMWPYNVKGRKGRLAISEPGEKASDVMADNGMPDIDNPILVRRSDLVRKDGQLGWWYHAAGGGVGDYAYTLSLADAKVLHAGPQKAHTFGGYIRYTADNRYISETRSLGVMTYDRERGRWAGGGGFGQSMHRDRTNDPGLA